MRKNKDAFVQQNPYTKRITLDVTPDMYKAIKLKAMELDTTMNDYLRQLIDEDTLYTKRGAK